MEYRLISSGEIFSAYVLFLLTKCNNSLDILCLKQLVFRKITCSTKRQSQHALRRLNCSLFYLIGLWKHVQCLIGLRELINSYRLCFASTNRNCTKQSKTTTLPYLRFFLVLRKQFLEWNKWSYL